MIGGLEVALALSGRALYTIMRVWVWPQSGRAQYNSDGDLFEWPRVPVAGYVTIQYT